MNFIEHLEFLYCFFRVENTQLKKYSNTNGKKLKKGPGLNKTEIDPEYVFALLLLGATYKKQRTEEQLQWLYLKFPHK